MSDAGTIWLRAVLALAASALLVWAATVALVLVAGARPALRPADAILVLGAAQYNGRPSPVLRARLDHALALYRQGLAPMLVFTGGVGAGDSVSEGEVARRYAEEHGVPPDAILLERQGMTSAESVSAAAALMRARGLESALVVSDPFHMLRLELLARRAGIRPYRAPAPGSPIDRVPEQRWRYVLRESLIFPAAALVGGR
ncbi:MAG TPA: YdcF family protein [Longimicrobiales bacterium]